MTDSHLDHFGLLDLPPRFAVDEAELERAYRRVQAQVHPDRFATAGAAERRVAMQWAARANEAFRTLRSPLARAAYLCERHGQPIEAESNTAMPADFLRHQMQWREELEEARDAGAADGVHRLAGEVQARRREVLERIARALDDTHDYAAAAAAVRELHFVERFAGEVDAALNGEAAAPAAGGS